MCWACHTAWPSLLDLCTAADAAAVAAAATIAAVTAVAAAAAFLQLRSLDCNFSLSRVTFYLSNLAKFSGRRRCLSG